MTLWEIYAALGVLSSFHHAWNTGMQVASLKVQAARDPRNNPDLIVADHGKLPYTILFWPAYWVSLIVTHLAVKRFTAPQEPARLTLKRPDPAA